MSNLFSSTVCLTWIKWSRHFNDRTFKWATVTLLRVLFACRLEVPWFGPGFNSMSCSSLIIGWKVNTQSWYRVVGVCDLFIFASTSSRKLVRHVIRWKARYWAFWKFAFPVYSPRYLGSWYAPRVLWELFFLKLVVWSRSRTDKLINVINMTEQEKTRPIPDTYLATVLAAVTFIRHR